MIGTARRAKIKGRVARSEEGARRVAGVRAVVSDNTPHLRHGLCDCTRKEKRHFLFLAGAVVSSRRLWGSVVEDGVRGLTVAMHISLPYHIAVLCVS